MFEGMDPVLVALQVAKAIIILVIGLIVIKIIIGILGKALKRGKLDPVLHSFIKSFTRLALIIILIITVLGSMNVPMTPLVTALGAAGVAIALALKDSLGNFAGGILILINRPFSIGDYIDDLSVTGIVEDIELMFTTVKTVDNKVMYIPNGKLSNGTIINYSREKLRRVDCKFGISYEANLIKALDVLKDVAMQSDSKIVDDLADHEIFVGVSSHDDSAVTIDLKAWCHSEDYWDVKYYLEKEVKLAFDKNNIEIPYPHMDVNIRNQA